MMIVFVLVAESGATRQPSFHLPASIQPWQVSWMSKFTEFILVTWNVLSDDKYVVKQEALAWCGENGKFLSAQLLQAFGLTSQ